MLKPTATHATSKEAPKSKAKQKADVKANSSSFTDGSLTAEEYHTYHSYRQKFSTYSEKVRANLAFIIQDKQTKLSSGLRLLSVGCGDASFDCEVFNSLPPSSRSNIERYVGVEPEFAQVLKARALVQKTLGNDGTTPAESDLKATTEVAVHAAYFTPKVAASLQEKFDIITFVFVLHLFESPKMMRQTVSNALNLLREGGEVVIVSPGRHGVPDLFLKYSGTKSLIWYPDNVLQVEVDTLKQELGKKGVTLAYAREPLKCSLRNLPKFNPDHDEVPEEVRGLCSFMLLQKISEVKLKAMAAEIYDESFVEEHVVFRIRLQSSNNSKL